MTRVEGSETTNTDTNTDTNTGNTNTGNTNTEDNEYDTGIWADNDVLVFKTMMIRFIPCEIQT